jgi:methionyl-tRNA formyltransferase
MKVVAIGRTEILYASILEVKKNGHELALIITCDEAPHYLKGADDFQLLAEKLGAEFVKTEHINTGEVTSIINKIKPDIAISINWKTIISQKVIDCFKYGIINAHAGDLPRYRGNAVPNWAILNGEKEVVLILHFMTTELDAGPILLQRRCPIKRDTRIGEIYDFLRVTYPQMFVEVLDGLERGAITPHEQPSDPSLALRCYPRLPRDNEIDWRQPASQINRLVRAVSEPFDGAYTFLGSEKLIIWRAHCVSSPSPFLGIPGQVAHRYPKTGEVTVITGDGFLVLEEVESGSKGRVKATQVIDSTRVRLGMHITEEITELNRRVTALEKQKEI